jgi:hypothetical protein
MRAHKDRSDRRKGRSEERRYQGGTGVLPNFETRIAPR